MKTGGTFFYMRQKGMKKYLAEMKLEAIGLFYE